MNAIVIILSALTLALASSGQVAVPSQEDFDWLDEHRDRAFDQVMPVAWAPRQLVAYRSFRDLYYDVPESHFVISFAPGSILRFDQVVATATVPVGRSIQAQLVELHRRSPDASLDELLPRVERRTWTVPVSRCPRLKRQVDALLKITIGIPNQNVIAIHPEMHRLVLTLQGAQVDAALTDPKDAAVRWALSTSEVLASCPG